MTNEALNARIKEFLGNKFLNGSICLHEQIYNY